jgi:hypothetical protein
MVQRSANHYAANAANNSDTLLSTHRSNFGTNGGSARRKQQTNGSANVSNTLLSHSKSNGHAAFDPDRYGEPQVKVAQLPHRF